MSQTLPPGPPQTIEEANCPRCGNKTLLASPPETYADTTVSDFVCTKKDQRPGEPGLSFCGYAFDWREGSGYPKPERATMREKAAEEAAAAAAAEAPPVETPAEATVDVSLPTPKEFREMTPAERVEKLPAAIASLRPQEYEDLTPTERKALASSPE